LVPTTYRDGLEVARYRQGLTQLRQEPDLTTGYTTGRGTILPWMRGPAACRHSIHGRHTYGILQRLGILDTVVHLAAKKKIMVHNPVELGQQFA